MHVSGEDQSQAGLEEFDDFAEEAEADEEADDFGDFDNAFEETPATGVDENVSISQQGDLPFIVSPRAISRS